MLSERERQDAAQQALQDAVDKLPREAEPGRDCWPEIANQLNPRETTIYNKRWMPVALAASVVISLFASFVAWQNFNRAQGLVADNAQMAFALERNDILHQIEDMAQDYDLAKSALLTQIMSGQANRDLALIGEVESNLIIIEQATLALKQVISEQPENVAMLRLLNQTYQQELAALTQLARLSQPGKDT